MRYAIVSSVYTIAVQQPIHTNPFTFAVNNRLWINRLRHWGISVEILQNTTRSFTPRSYIFFLLLLSTHNSKCRNLCEPLQTLWTLFRRWARQYIELATVLFEMWNRHTDFWFGVDDWSKSSTVSLPLNSRWCAQRTWT